MINSKKLSAFLAITLSGLSPLESNVSPPPDVKLGLDFPILGLTPYTAGIRNIFDHSSDGPYYTSAKVVSYKGEEASIRINDEGCMAQDTNKPFQVNGHYVGTDQGPSVLCYDAHPGYDFAVKEGTPVLAAASGIIRYPELYHSVSARLHNTVEIEHPGTGCSTFYLHMKEKFFKDGDFVAVGGVIGLSGNVGTTSFYLHFEVQCDGKPVDPYGWDAKGTDPYYVQNVRLWN